MSTAAQVQAAWLTNIWNHATIQAITTQILGYEATDLSESELAAQFEVPSNGISRVNFVQYLVTRTQQFAITNALVYSYSVKIDYFLSTDVDGTSWGQVRDFFDTVFNLVLSQMHPSWGDTVDYYQPQSGPAEITKTQILTEPCWQGRYIYTATKQVSI